MNIADIFLWIVYLCGAGLIFFVMTKLFKTMFPNGIKNFVGNNNNQTIKTRSVTDASIEELEKNKKYLEDNLKKVNEEITKRKGVTKQ